MACPAHESHLQLVLIVTLSVALLPLPLPAVPWLTKLANGFIQGRLQDSSTQVCMAVAGAQRTVQMQDDSSSSSVAQQQALPGAQLLSL